MDENKLIDLLSNKVELGTFPTPIQRLKNFEIDMNFKEIYIKRDDLTGLGPGGNKIRSLEYILSDAIKNDSDIIIASGPLQSNLCTLAACACNKLNLKCILVLNSDKPHNFEGNLLLNKLLDVEMHFIGKVDEHMRSAYVNSLYSKLKKENRKPYIITNGASTGLGALGYVNAIYEILSQCSVNNIKIDEIFVPGGNGGVATGVIYGNAALGFPYKINVISVEYEKDKLHRNIENIIGELEKLTGKTFEYNLSDICNIIDDYRGDGWGKNTAESEDMIFTFAQKEGIFIENIYNSKAVVGMIDMIKKGMVKGNPCYIHTGGFGSLFSQY